MNERVLRGAAAKPSKKPSISFVGAGRLARALALALNKKGYAIDEFLVRGRSSRQKLNAGLAKTLLAEARLIKDAEFRSIIIWLCVPDDAIAPLAARLASSYDWDQKIVFHSSGALPSSVLAALRKRGASVASIHPMMSFSDVPIPLVSGIVFGVAGDARATGFARSIVKDLGGSTLVLQEKDKAIYHLMSTFCSPLLIALLAGAEQLGGELRLSPVSTRKAIAPLLQATVQNYVLSGAKLAFTGPVRRGDIKTIKMHLDALNSFPDLREAYCALLKIATGELPTRRTREINSLLRARKSGSTRK